MKLVVIGLGQCGGKIADEFARLNARARIQRGIEIVTGTFAINTDVADLSGLSVNDSTARHTARIVFGKDRDHKSEFVHPDLSKEFPGYLALLAS